MRIAFPFQYENKRGIEIIVIKLSMSCLKTYFCGISASHLFVRVRNKTCMAESLGSNQLAVADVSYVDFWFLLTVGIFLKNFDVNLMGEDHRNLDTV